MPAHDRKLTMAEMGRTDAAGYKAMSKRPVRLVLDDVRSRHNVGSVFRTADAFGLEGLVLCGFTPCPPHREIEKTALGATLSVPWEHHPTVEAALTSLIVSGHDLWCVEQTTHAVPLQEWRPDPRKPLALVFGNELTGVSERAIAMAAGCLVLPQHGTKHSLNVSVCAGIVAWHAVQASFHHQHQATGGL